MCCFKAENKMKLKKGIQLFFISFKSLPIKRVKDIISWVIVLPNN